MSELSGFYYDLQLNNPTTMVTLHPNTLPPDESGGEWKHVKEDDGENYSNHNSDKNGKKTDLYKYAKEPIFTAIMTDELNISIANTFTPVGDDAIGGMWNSFKPLAPYLKDTSIALNEMSEKTKNWEENENTDKGGFIEKAATRLTSVFHKGGKLLGTASKYLARSLVVKGTSFSYYGGTGVDFGTLQMKTTLLSQYNKSGEFKSVDDQLEGILPYVIGDYIPVSEFGTDNVGTFISQHADWQLPPGGFEADMINIDNIQKGTLKLRIGPYIAIENLVIGGCTLNYSKAMVKNPVGSPKKLYPLSCEVTLILRPITKYSKNSLLRFIEGTASAVYMKDNVEDKLDLAENLT